MEFKLKDIAEFNTTSLSKKNMPTVINYLDTSNITNGIIDEIVSLNTEYDKVPSRARRRVAENDIIYSTVRPNQKHFGFITKNLAHITVSTGFTVIKANKEFVNPYYLYSYLTTDRVTNLLQGIAENSTTAYPSIKPSDIGDLLIELPSLNVQEYIVNLIFNINLKLKTNLNIISNLEKLSQTLFKNWFIDFEFPNEEGKPYKSSGGEMLESELGEIPVNWKVTTISDISKITMGQSPKSDTYNTDKIGLPLLNGAADFKNCNLSPNKYTSDPKKTGNKGDYVFGVRATIGLVTELDNTYAIGRGTGIATPLNSSLKEFVYETLKKAFNEFKYTASGSVYLNISKNDLNDFKLVKPTDKLIEKYHSHMKGILTQKQNLIQENITLKNLRDTLLPKLLSGEIEIPDELEV